MVIYPRFLAQKQAKQIKSAIIFSMTYDLIIIGGGPAGVAAGVYAARKNLKTLFLTSDWGGQSIVSADIQNWIGSPHISGADLAKNLKTHLETYAGQWVEIKSGEWVTGVTKTDSGNFVATTKSGAAHEARAILITTGGSRRKLVAPGADQFENKGLTYCASCDGPFFADQDVVVLGGGNAGFESAAQLLAYCKSVTLIHKHKDFKADEITVKMVTANPKMKVVTNAEILEVKGGDFVNAIVYKDKDSNQVTELPTTGIFVEIGFMPNTDLVKSVANLTPDGKIITDPKNQRTSTDGIWAAGDCTDGLYHQNNIAAGDAVKALEDIYIWLHNKK